MTTPMPKRGVIGPDGKLTRPGHHFLAGTGKQAGTGGGGGFVTDDEPIYIEEPLIQTYPVIVNRRFSGVIEAVSAIADQGTCELALLVDGAQVGAPNAVSDQMSVIEHDAEFGPGSLWALSVMNAVACFGLSVNIWYRRNT